MKRFEVMAEITIARTIIVKANSEDEAFAIGKEKIENAYESLGDKHYSTSTDELVISIGDVTEEQS